MKGHIRERSSGHWAIILDAKDPVTGQRKRRWHSFKGTKRQAQIRCAELVAELQSGASIDPNKIAVAEFLDRFDRDWIATHVSPHSRERYQFALNHVRRHLGNKQLQKVRPADLPHIFASRLRTAVPPRRINLVRVVFHRAFGQAKIGGIVLDNPAELAKPAAASIQEVVMLQPDQAAALLERLHGKK